MSELKKEEIINGKIYAMSSGFSAHGWASSKLGDKFKEYFKLKRNFQCQVFVENLDLFLNESNRKEYVTPDVMIMCDLSKLDKRGYRGVPELVIEVLSYSTRDRDLPGGDKFDLYERSGIKEYWICSYKEKSIAQYILVNGKYELKKTIICLDDAEIDVLTEEEKSKYTSVIRSYVFDDLEIDLRDNIFYDRFNV
ncbi:MAG: Uma2 family endonuclease [Oscillospiraceae bacterium]|nr:Uma2 family endonuclease [Oscillospiraceae bacterium]